MRVFGGACSRMVFGCLIGLTMAMHGASAQEAVPAAPAEPVAPVAIEIIGEPAPEPVAAPAKTAPEPLATPTPEPATSDLAPTAIEPLAATATTSATATASAGAGAESGAPREKVDPFVGSFSTAVPIEVPPFHGIAPNLALTYNSSRGNGFVGVGWELSGLSVIERASPGKGAPRHDPNDIFLLDGQELVLCATGMVSPSCATGGTHATKVESYLRIKQDTTGNLWEIHGRDGTKTTYTAVMGPDLLAEIGTYRWAMTGVVDTHGNTVTYNWWCDGAPAVECYPDTIAYNGATVRFHREVRTDAITNAMGSLIGQIDYRLKSVDVVLSTDRIRAYEYSYGTSTSSSQSQLANVKMYGRDAALDASGAVIGGSSLPALSLAWVAEPTGEFVSGPHDHPVTAGAFTAANGWERFAGDANGDGRTDAIFVQTPSSGIVVQALLSNGDGTFTSGPQHQPVTGGIFTAEFGWRHFTGDANGDGKTDVIFVRTPSSGIVVRALLSNGDGTFTSGPHHQPVTAGTFTKGLGWRQFIADVNGDGSSDLVFSCAGCGVIGIQVRALLANGDGTFVSALHHQPVTAGDFAAWTQEVSDVNGDGKADLLFSCAGCGVAGIQVRALLA